MDRFSSFESNEMIKKVLVPTDDVSILAELLPGYTENQFEVIAGTVNFWQKNIRCEFLHLLWPEELSNWQSPNEGMLNKIEKCLQVWRELCPLVFSVNNLYPHGCEDDIGYKRLYSLVLEYASLIVHHSHASKELVEQRYPVARGRAHIVTTMFSYDRLLRTAIERESSRARFGVCEEDFVFLVFGAIRSVRELQLLKSSFRKCNLKNKKLLMAGRVNHNGNALSRRINKVLFNWWLQYNNCINRAEYIPDEEICEFFEAADAVVIPRIDDLSSGVVGLAMSFGKLMIAPNHGAFPDYLKNTCNLLYDSGSVDSLSRCMAMSAEVDVTKVWKENRCRASQWTWKKIVCDIVCSLP